MSEELKTEEMLLINTNAQLGVLDEQLRQFGSLGRIVRQLQEEEEKTKSERSSRIGEIEERLRHVKVINLRNICLSRARLSQRPSPTTRVFFNLNDDLELQLNEDVDV